MRFSKRKIWQEKNEHGKARYHGPINWKVSVDNSTVSRRFEIHNNYQSLPANERLENEFYFVPVREDMTLVFQVGFVGLVTITCDAMRTLSKSVLDSISITPSEEAASKIRNTKNENSGEYNSEAFAPLKWPI